MTLPFSYALRNLARRPSRTVVTVLGLALVAFLVILTGGFSVGLARSASETARDDVAVVVGLSGETDLVRSFLPAGSAREIADAAPGVLVRDGRRAASIELHAATRVGDRIGLLRGVTDAAFLVHPAVVVVEGVEPRAPFDLLVGRLAHARMGLPESALALGATIRLEDRDWRVVGRFAAPGSVLEAELWGRLDDVARATRRVDVSCVALRLADPATFPRLLLYTAQNLRLEATAIREREVYGALGASLAPLSALALAMAALVLVGGTAACANTMFAAVLSRTREVGTLRVLGHGTLSIGASVMQEALLLAAFGGALGIVAAASLGEVALRFPSGAFTLDLSGGVLALGALAAACAGLFGGFVPALRAVRVPLPLALGVQP